MDNDTGFVFVTAQGRVMKRLKDGTVVDADAFGETVLQDALKACATIRWANRPQKPAPSIRAVLL